MSDNIPTDLLSNILLRLPFHSLIQFRCVSKSWRDSIDSHYFKQMHFEKSLLIKSHPHPDSKIIAFNDGKFYAFDSVRKIGSSLYNASTARELQFPLPNSKFSKRNIILTGSSNGVLCLSSSRTDDLVLWNPWTGKWSMLPPCPNEFTKYYRWSKGYDPVVGAAFGHDVTNHDYKVVKWHISLNHSTMSTSDRYEVCVYSLKTNSWKRISDASIQLPFHHLPSFFPRENTFVNGAIHWLVRDEFIVAFDLETEGFRKISCEPCFTINSSNYRLREELCCLNGRLCYLVHFWDRDFLCFGWDIWEMEDYGVEGSWRKMISMEASPNMTYCLRIRKMRPLAFSRKMRRLFFQNDIMSNRMGVYDMEKKVFGEVLINGEAMKSAVSCLLCVGSFANPCHSTV